MTCDVAKQLIYRGPTTREALPLRLHLLRCARCRQEAHAVRGLNRALSALPRHQPSPELLARLLAVPHGSTIPLPTKEKRTMRRLVFVAAALVAIAALTIVVLPGRGAKQQARTLLAGVAHAMESVVSLHQSGRDGGPQGLQPGRTDDWFGARAIANRYYDEQSGILVASRADLDAHEWWFYDERTHTRYVADLTPVMEQAEKAVPRLLRIMTAGYFEQDPARYDWPDAQASVSSGTHDGKPVKLVTIDRKLDLPEQKPPIHVTDRYIYTVDPATEHLLATQRHWLQKNGTDQLIEDEDTIEYDVPIPDAKELLAPASEVRDVPAEAVVSELDGGDRALVLTVHGQPLNPGSILTTLKFGGS